MPVEFDPYHKWLGIAPEEQPANHYRLLGLRPFESDPDVIESAADRQMRHVQAYQSGSRSHLSQKLLNELARAKVCLLSPTEKAAYDQSLRAQLSSSTFRRDNTSPRPNTQGFSSSASAARTNRSKGPLRTAAEIALGGIAGIAVAVALLWFGLRMDPFGLFSAEVARSNPSAPVNPVTDQNSVRPVADQNGKRPDKPAASASKAKEPPNRPAATPPDLPRQAASTPPIDPALIENDEHSLPSSPVAEPGDSLAQAPASQPSDDDLHFIAAPADVNLWHVDQGIEVVAHSPLLEDRNMRSLFNCPLEGDQQAVRERLGQNVMFHDKDPRGTTHFVEWETAKPVRIRRLTLWIHGKSDPSDGRHIRVATIFAWNERKRVYDKMFEVFPGDPYQNTKPPEGIKLLPSKEPHSVILEATLPLTIARRFRAEFEQAGDRGPRICELKAFATSGKPGR